MDGCGRMMGNLVMFQSCALSYLLIRLDMDPTKIQQTTEFTDYCYHILKYMKDT
jgi:hypothetical protein